MRPSVSPSETTTMSPHQSYILFCCSAAFLHTERLRLNGIICLGTDCSHLTTAMAAPYFWICLFPVSDLRLSVTRSANKQTFRRSHQPSTHCLRGKQPFQTGTDPPPHRLFGNAENTSLFFCLYHLRTNNSAQNEIHKNKRTQQSARFPVAH